MTSGHNISEIAERNKPPPFKISTTTSPRDWYQELPEQSDNPLPFSAKFDEMIMFTLELEICGVN